MSFINGTVTCTPDPRNVIVTRLLYLPLAAGLLISIRNFYHHTTWLFWTYESSPASVAYDCHFMILWNIWNRIPARTKVLLPPPMLEPFEIRLQNLQTSERSKRAKQPCGPSKNNYLHTQRDSRLVTTSKKEIYPPVINADLMGTNGLKITSFQAFILLPCRITWVSGLPWGLRGRRDAWC